MLSTLYYVKNFLTTLDKDIQSIKENGGAELFTDPEIHLNVGNALLGVEEMIRDCPPPGQLGLLKARLDKAENRVTELEADMLIKSENLKLYRDSLQKTSKALQDEVNYSQNGSTDDCEQALSVARQLLADPATA